jgi:hypothetical protein
MCWAGLGLAAALVSVGTDVARAFDDFDKAAVDVFVVLPIFALAAIALALPWLVVLRARLYAGRWGAFALTLIAPILALAAPMALYASGLDARFLVERPRLERLAAAAAGPAGQRYLNLPWDETGGAGLTNTQTRVIYDETDRLPARIAADPSRRCTAVIRKGRHFYLVNDVLDGC